MSKTSFKTFGLGFAAVTLLASAPAFAAEGGGHHIDRQTWAFGGLTGQYDKAQLQRGFQIYKDVCSACHGMKRVYFRNLVQPGGPEFPEASVKELAAQWPNQITDGPNDAGEMFDRPAKLSDPMLGPYKNDKAARAAQGGALPPDLSNIAKARNVHNSAFWPKHVWLMAKDIATGYQEGGADYLYALLTGYQEPPAGVKLADGMNYNVAFPGHQIAMAPPLSKEGFQTYADGSGSLEKNAADVAAYLTWASDPSLNSRKSTGWVVLLYLLVTTVLLWLGKKRIWANAH
ncbi:MAG: cytochrome c1 [Hyphomicrobiaceae bacterium]|jgi:ubiquinol-cytochrome c reductase cytochrome c1 subunit|nr:cytochrome c1 [Hyphomicrobiaceae bacterium]